MLFEKIKRGLEDALAFSRGDHSKAKVTVFINAEWKRSGNLFIATVDIDGDEMKVLGTSFPMLKLEVVRVLSRYRELHGQAPAELHVAYQEKR